MAIPTCSWDRITTLALQSQDSFFTLDEQQTMEIVAQCVNLQSCRLVFPFSMWSNPNSPGPRRLRIWQRPMLDSTWREFRIVSSCLLSEELEVEGIPLMRNGPTGVILDPSTDMMFALDDLVLCSSCTLRVLTVNMVTGDVAPFLRCLA
ncbi:hypothetical protein C8R44DRAFT_880672 [Mycena epipterygia]|nr:hypothetical protein C8R44DRAFT_880672 [Mycena epipterygia]